MSRLDAWRAYAVAALQGLCVNNGECGAGAVATTARRIADRMMAAEDEARRELEARWKEREAQS